MIKKKIKKYDYDYLALKNKSLSNYVYLDQKGKTTIDF